MKEIKCDNCGEVTEKYPSQISENNFCSQECHQEWSVGKNNPSWSGGRMKSKCIVCETSFKYYESQRSGDYCSPECKSKNERRESYQKTRYFYNRTKWMNRREEIKSRDNNMCQWCDEDGTNMALQVHHLHPIELGGAKYDSSNLVTLCNRCHRLAHNAIKRL